jgi:hypothetical protein
MTELEKMDYVSKLLEDLINKTHAEGIETADVAFAMTGLITSILKRRGKPEAGIQAMLCGVVAAYFRFVAAGGEEALMVMQPGGHE